MSGFATDTVIDHYGIDLGDGRWINLTVTNDGSGNDPDVTAELCDQLDPGCISLPVDHARTVLIDGIDEEEDSDD